MQNSQAQLAGITHTSAVIPTVTDVTNIVTANTTQISGDSVAADNLELFYDGTGYAAANSTIGTATTVTNIVTANTTQISGDSVAADNAELFFDNTGFAASNSTIGTATTVTNIVTANVTQISGDSVAADNLESYTDGTTPMPVNATQLSGDATAADNAESFFDGTGYAGTGNTIPTTTTVTNGVTVTTNNDKTGYTLSAAGVQAVWDALTSALTTVGSVGKRIADNLDATVSSRLASASYTAPPSAATVADSVWDEARADHVGAGSFGQGAASVQGNVTGSVGSVTGSVTVGTNSDKTGYALSAGGVQAIWDALTSALTTAGSIGKLFVDNLNATVSSRLASASYTTPPTADQNADALLDRTNGVETSITPRGALRLMLSALAGKLSGAATTTVVIRNVGDSKDRITATVDANGNRSVVNTDAT